MQGFSFKRFFILSVLSFLLTLMGAVLIFSRVASAPLLKHRIETAASRFLGSPLTIESIEWQWGARWGLIGRNVRLWENSSQNRFLLEAPRVEARVTLLSLLKLSASVAEMEFIRPRLVFNRGQDGRWNIERIIESVRKRPKASKRRWGLLSFNWFVIEDGNVTATDEQIDETLVPPIKLSGRIKFDPLASKIRFSGVVASTAAAAEFAGTVAPKPLVADLDFKTLRYQAVTLPNVRAVIRKEGDLYTLDQTQFEALGGTVSVKGSYRLKTSTDSLKIIWRTDGVQVSELFRLFGSSVEARGTCNTDGYFVTGVGARFGPNMNGELKVNVREGWFGEAPVLLKILTRINLRTLIAEVKGDHRSRVPFDETNGVFKIVNGVVHTVEPFVLKNKTLQMAFMGQYDLANKTLDAKVAVNFLTLTDEIIRLLPGVRDVLLGDQGGLTPIWLEVKGSASDPKIKILTGKSIMSPVWNTLGNFFRLPGKIRDKLIK